MTNQTFTWLSGVTPVLTQAIDHKNRMLFEITFKDGEIWGRYHDDRRAGPFAKLKEAKEHFKSHASFIKEAPAKKAIDPGDLRHEKETSSPVSLGSGVGLINRQKKRFNFERKENPLLNKNSREIGRFEVIQDFTHQDHREFKEGLSKALIEVKGMGSKLKIGQFLRLDFESRSIDTLVFSVNQEGKKIIASVVSRGKIFPTSIAA